MSSFSPKERLLRVLDNKAVDRPPVICTGGMMNAAIVQVMNLTGNTLPAAHHQGELMAALAGDIHDHTGFENIGIPFCMTVEAEVLGSDIDYGTLACEPKIERERFPSSAQVEFRDIATMLRSGRIAEVVQAGHHIARKNPGPAGDRQPDRPDQHRRLHRRSGHLPERVAQGCREFPSGAGVCQRSFDRLCRRDGGQRRDHGLRSATRPPPAKYWDPGCSRSTPCVTSTRSSTASTALARRSSSTSAGELQSVKQFLPRLRCDAVSTDALVNLKLLKEEYPRPEGHGQRQHLHAGAGG